MTCENNKKGCNNKFLISTWMLVSMVCILSVSDMFGARILPSSQSIYTTQSTKPPIFIVLSNEILYKVFVEDEKFKQHIDDLNKKGEYSIEYKRCCCWRGNVLYAAVYDKNKIMQGFVYNLIYEALEVDTGNYLKLSNSPSNLSVDTGVYQYIIDNKVLDELNKAINPENPETIININEPYDKFKEGAEVTK